MRLTRDDWLAAGFELLREHGAGAVTIDRLTQRLGVTKGSFYHHFTNRDELSLALLEAWERKLTGELIEASRLGRDFAERNRQLTGRGLELYEPRLEVAIRAWALHDPVARAVQERVDQRRLNYLEELFRLLTNDLQLAADLAQIRYAFTVGAEQLQPALGQAQYGRLFDALERQLESLARTPPEHPGDSP